MSHFVTRRSFLSAAAVAIPLGFAGCRPPMAGAQTRVLRIIATTPMLGDLVRRIAPAATTEHLFGEGVDPHLYKPTRTDIVSIMDADVIVTNGLFLEGRMRDAFDRAAESGRTVIAVGDALPAEHLLHEDGAKGHPDPHVWMDPSLWGICGLLLAKRLASHDPGQEAGYSERARTFAEFAEALTTNARGAFATIPKERRVLVTAHDAFGYFGRSFDLEVHAIQGISTESEAGLSDLEGLVDFLVKRSVPAVFVESTVSPRTIQALIAGAQARGHLVRIGGELYADSMGPAGTPEGTWPGMIAHNVKTIVTALGGIYPEDGILPEGLRHVSA